MKTRQLIFDSYLMSILKLHVSFNVRVEEYRHVAMAAMALTTYPTRLHIKVTIFCGLH